MRKLPPLAQLRAFEAAARHMSFKAAADELAVTPTAISHQIKLLEQFCGTELFRRRPRPLTLTSAGSLLYPTVRDGMDSFSTAIQAVREGHADQSIVVTTTNAFASRWLIPKLASWRVKFPNIGIEVVGTDKVLDLRSGDCDVAIRCANSQPDEFVSHEIFRTSFHLMCSPRLVGNGDKIEGLQQLKEHTLINWYWSPTDRKSPIWQYWQKLQRMAGLTNADLENIKQVTFQEELHAIEAVVEGQGFAVIDEALVDNELKSGSLVKVTQLAQPGPGYYLVYQFDHPKKQAIDDFVRWTKSFT